jgi:hypothetical protein
MKMMPGVNFSNYTIFGGYVVTGTGLPMFEFNDFPATISKKKKKIQMTKWRLFDECLFFGKY